MRHFSSAMDTLYLFINLGDGSPNASDSVIFFFDTNRDRVIGSEDGGVWFRRGGEAQSIDETRTTHLGALTPFGNGTPANNTCAALTRVCIIDTPTAWRVEAKLVPSDFAMTTFAGTVGAYLRAFNVNSGTASIWRAGVVVAQPDSYVPLKLGTPNYRFCFRDIINTPDAFTTPPTIDGVVDGDNGWTSSWRYVFHSGLPDPDVIVQGIKNSTHIFLSFEVSNDADFNADDLVSIGFDPSSAADDEWYLNVKPLTSGGVSATIRKERWTGPFAGSFDNAPGVVVAATTEPGARHPWNLELQIPRSAIPGLPAAQEFGFYVNAHPTNGSTSGPFGTTGEFPWPTEKNAVMGSDEHVFPDPGNWGRATLAPVSCNGVTIAPGDIATNNSPPSKISLTNPNTFRATVRNSSIAGNGAFIPAPNVTAEFKIANFGLPSAMAWRAVEEDPGTSNPTTPATIPANGSATLSFQWTLNSTEQGQYDDPTTEHQCILVELDAGGPAGTMTTFANKSAWTNMKFGTASSFKSFAVVDGRGYGRPPARRSSHLFQLTTERRETTFVQPPDSVSDSAAKTWRPYSQLIHLVHGCRLSGRQITIGRRTYNVCERIGSFGHVIAHEGATAPQWRVSLGGQGLVALTGEPGGAFHLRVPPDSQILLRVDIAAGRKGIPLWVWIALAVILLLGLVWRLFRR